MDNINHLAYLRASGLVLSAVNYKTPSQIQNLMWAD